MANRTGTEGLLDEVALQRRAMARRGVRPYERALALLPTVLEGTPGRFLAGVQWHPEHLVGGSEPARRLFAALIAAART